jgi:hypothetical protein
MAGFGNTLDHLWPLTILGASVGITIPAQNAYGLKGLLAFPVSLVVFGLLAIAWSRFMRPSAAFTLLNDHSAMHNEPCRSEIRENGWVHCPTCKRSFVINDQRVWDGERHNCGQRLILSE